MALGNGYSRKALRLAAAGIVAAATGACSFLTSLPDPVTAEQRLDAIPIDGLDLEGRVTIHWDPHMIPFVEAERDADLPVALGLVHAHLRLGQMALLRRVARGRLAEVAGPLAADIDEGLRIIGFGRAAPEIEAQLPPASRAWLEGYVRGLNHYQANVATLPHEYELLGIGREPWTVQDVLAFGRLSGTDVNWLAFLPMLGLRDRADWPRLWQQLLEEGRDSIPSFTAEGANAALFDILKGVSKSGSNSLALAPRRTKSGAAMIANDPHLGITVPNIWLIVGAKSPSFHAVGLMVPGLPIFAIGRNERIAWGGTNMRAAASDLVDVSGLDPATIVERKETVRVRWWRDREITVRETPYGPIVTDAPLLAGRELPPVAVRWTGHRVSDEVGAMLRVARAGNFAEFRAAFEAFGVPGQNMLYADIDGNIGQVMAVQLPKRDRPPEDLVVSPARSDRAWAEMVSVTDLPFALNPPDGFLASANNRPANAGPLVGYFFSPDDRMIRMQDRVESTPAFGLQEIAALQQDVRMPSSLRLRDALLPALNRATPESDTVREAVALIRDWDGAYAETSRGALAFELFRVAFAETFRKSLYGEDDAKGLGDVGQSMKRLAMEAGRAPHAIVDAAVAAGLRSAAEGLDDFADWGAMHRLRVAHPFSFLPLLGGRYEFGDYPVGGSSHTLMKTAHDATTERHATRYGANARHVSDMSDPDANWFVLLGGQDGWFNSPAFLDQVPLWRAGDYVQVPLSLEAFKARAAWRTDLRP